MHYEVMAFAREVREKFPGHFRNSRVLELGSLDINGSVRPLFTDCMYVGVDKNAGPGVDVVGWFRDVLPPLPAGSMDVVLSLEALEHDPDRRTTMAETTRLLRPGGLLIVTTAYESRPTHELHVTGYYENVQLKEFAYWLRPAEYGDLEIRITRGNMDIAAWAIKA